MGLRGPKAQGKLSVIEPRPVQRPKPFSGMSDKAKGVWKRIIDDLPADFYAKHELDLLREYCEQAARASRANEMVTTQGEVLEIETEHGTKQVVNKWLDVANGADNIMSTLGTKLRIAKNSKLSNKQASKIESGQKRSNRSELMFNG